MQPPWAEWSRHGSPVPHHLQESAQTHVHRVDGVPHLIPRHPLLHLPSVFPRARVCSSELSLCIRCPEYWASASASVPCNEYSGLIPFRIHWLDLQSRGFSRQMRLRDCKLCWHPSLVRDPTSDLTAIKKKKKKKSPNQVLWGGDTQFFKAEVSECLSLLAKQ